MGWLERLGRVIRANINSLIQETQDPEKVLEQAVLEMEQELIEMRRALAAAIATYKSTERQIANQQRMAQRWYERAQLALDRGNEPSARECLVHRQSYLNSTQSLQAQLEQQSGVIGKFKQDLGDLELKFAEVKAKKSLYVARLRSAIARQKMQEMAGNYVNGGYESIFDQLETKILELEAESQLMAAIVPDSLDQKFAALEEGEQVEAELSHLKAKRLSSPHQANFPPQKNLPSQQTGNDPEIEQLRSELDCL